LPSKHSSSGDKSALTCGWEDEKEALPLEELVKHLGTSLDGLPQVKGKKRLVEYGPNAIEEKRSTPF
jgi:H+-transporting ATPase